LRANRARKSHGCDFGLLVAFCALVLTAACTGGTSTSAPRGPKPVISPGPSSVPPSPLPAKASRQPRGQQHTSVVAVAAVANDVRLLVQACTKACHESYLSSPDGGRTFLAPRALPAPSTAYTGMALAAHGVAYVWSSSAKSVLWTKDDGHHWTRSGPLVLKDITVQGDSVWAVTTACAATCRDLLLAGRTGASPASWKPLPLAARPQLAVSRVSGLTSFAVGSTAKGTELLTSRTSGRTWTKRPGPCAAGSDGSVSAVDVRVLWVLCSGKSFVSVDGGGSWKGPYAVGAGVRHVHAMTAKRAYATGGRSAILTTVDGGRHWSADTDYEDGFGRLAETANGTLLSAVAAELGEGSGDNGSVWRRPRGGPWSVQVIARAG
jgi:photosystem II stability/assembly factor-like uncharacterized protein